MTPQKARAVNRPDHPAAAVVDAFWDMRDYCRHYTGIEERDDSKQCRHPENRGACGAWCAMDVCPLLHERARVKNVGWG